LNSTPNYPKEYIIDSWKNYILTKDQQMQLPMPKKKMYLLDEIDFDDFLWTENFFIAYVKPRVISNFL